MGSGGLGTRGLERRLQRLDRHLVLTAHGGNVDGVEVVREEQHADRSNDAALVEAGSSANLLASGASRPPGEPLPPPRGLIVQRSPSTWRPSPRLSTWTGGSYGDGGTGFRVRSLGQPGICLAVPTRTSPLSGFANS